MLYQVLLNGPVRFNSRTGKPSSVQIAGALLKTAFEQEESGKALIADELFAVSELLLTANSEPLVTVNDFLTISGRQVSDLKIRKKLAKITCKLSDLSKLSSYSEEELLNLNQLKLQKEEEEQEKLLPEAQIYRVSNSRPNTKEKNMFYYKVLQLESPALIVSCAPSSLEIIKQALTQLSYSGFGSDKTIGLGGFSGFSVRELSIPSANGSTKLNISHYIPSEESTKVQSRIVKYSPYVHGKIHEVLCHRPFGIVHLDKEVDGKVITLLEKKVLNFRSVLLPINI